MKRLVVYLLILLSVITLFSCKKQEEKKKEDIQVIYTIPLGDYQDLQSKRAAMTVSFKNKVYCFEINWANSASENVRWYFSGKYDKNIGGVVYNNEKCYNDIYDENGECISTETYYDGSGTIIYKDSKLYWDDNQEEKYDNEYNCIFEKIKYED